jgi:hypothetical protein
MTDKQIEEKLQEIETRNPERFKQYKLKDHVYWTTATEGVTKLKWGFHASFVGNLLPKVKVEVSKLMNKAIKSEPVSAKAEKETETEEEAI